MSPLAETMWLGGAGGAATAAAIYAANAQARRKPWDSYTGKSAYFLVTLLYPVLGACMAGFGLIIGFKGAAVLAGFTGLAALAKLAGEAQRSEPESQSATAQLKSPPPAGGGGPA